MQTNWLKYVFFLFFRQFYLHFETKWKLAEPRTDRKSLTERRNPSRIDAKPTTTKLTRPISVQLPSSFLFLEQNKKLCEHHVPAFQKVKMPRRKDLLSCFVDGSLADSYCYWIARFFVLYRKYCEVSFFLPEFSRGEREKGMYRKKNRAPQWKRNSAYCCFRWFWHGFCQVICQFC